MFWCLQMRSASVSPSWWQFTFSPDDHDIFKTTPGRISFSLLCTIWKTGCMHFTPPVLLFSLDIFSLSDHFWKKRLKPIIINVLIHPGVNTYTRFFFFAPHSPSYLSLLSLSFSLTHIHPHTPSERERDWESKT